MDNDYFTNKEIIFGLRKDFLLKDQIVKEIHNLMVPEKKTIEIRTSYDYSSKRIDFDAYYISIYRELINKVINKRYVYNASLRQEDNGAYVFDEHKDSFPRKHFPVKMSLEDSCKLFNLFEQLLRADYKVGRIYSNVFSYYNSLLIWNNEIGEKANFIEYSSYKDALSFSLGSQRFGANYLKELFEFKHLKDELSDTAIEAIENNPSTYKPVRFIEIQSNDEENKNFEYSISEKKDEIVLIRKFKK